MRRFGTLLPVVMIILLAAAFTNVVPFRQFLAQQESIELANQKLETLQKESARLEAEVAALQTPAEIERLARQDLGYVFEGENAYVVTSSAAPESYLAPTPARPVAEERPWYQGIWDFLTGRDLVQNPS